jgi:tetratricopeptide (TPR) repeat protein
MWDTLKIEKTTDEEKIKAAYRAELVHTNPEENPEGFKKLRTAYEEACEWARKAKKQKKPIEQWLYDMEQVYENFYRRIDEDEWDEIFDNEVCTDLDTQEEARFEMIRFLMEHYFLPQFVWKRAWDVFEFEEDRDMIKEKVSNDFLTYIEFRSESEDYFDYQLYEGPMEADYDEYIKNIHTFRTYIEEERIEPADEMIENLRTSPITHPYAKIEMVKYYLKKQDLHWKLLWKEVQEELYDDPVQIQTEGEIAFYEEDYERAERAFLTVLEETNGFPETYRKLVELYTKMERYEDAKKICLEVLDHKTPDEKICLQMIEINEKLIIEWKDRDDKQIDLAWCYYQNQKFEESLTVLRGMPKEKGEIFDYYNLIARVLLETGDYEEGYEMTKIWISNIEHLKGDEPDYERKSKRYGYAHFIASMHCMELDLKEKSDEYFKRSLELDVEQMDRLMYRERRMDAFLKRKEYERCIQEANIVLENSEFFYPAYVYRQEAHYHLYHAQNVMDDFYRAIGLVPDQGKPYIFVIKMLIEFSMLGEVKEILEMGRNNHVQDPEFHFYELEYERFHQTDPKRLREIADEMEAMIEKLPDKKAVIHYRLGLIYDKLAEYENDIDKIDLVLDYAMQAVEEDEQMPQYHWLLADTWQKKGDHIKAIESYKKVLELDPSLSDAWIDMGDSYDALGNLNIAIEVMEKGAHEREHHEYVHNSLMNLYLRRFSDDRDREDFNRALLHADMQLDIIENDYFYRERAYLYMEDGQLENAFEDIKKSYELAPEDLYALSSMGYIYRLMGNYPLAIEFYKKAEKQARTNSQKFSLYHWWGPIYERNGQFEEALECYRKCLAIRSYDTDVLEDIGEIYMRMHQYEKAAEYYLKSIQAQESKQQELLIKVAKAYFYGKKYLKMRKALKQLELTYPNDPDVNCKIAEFYLEEKNDLKKAYKYYVNACGSYTEEPYVRLVEVYALMGKPEDAKKMCRLAEQKIDEIYGSIEDYFRKKENQKYVYYNIAMMYYYTSDMDIVKMYRTCMDKRPMCYFCPYGFCYEQEFLDAAVLAAEGKVLKAAKICRRILKQDQNLGQVRHFLNLLEERIEHDNRN